MRRPRGPTQSEEIHENGNQEDPTEISQEVQQDRSIVGARSSSEAVMARPGPLRASCGHTKSAGLPGMAIPQFHFMTEISSIKICERAQRQVRSCREQDLAVGESLKKPTRVENLSSEAQFSGMVLKLVPSVSIVDSMKWLPVNGR